MKFFYLTQTNVCQIYSYINGQVTYQFSYAMCLNDVGGWEGGVGEEGWGYH